MWFESTNEVCSCSLFNCSRTKTSHNAQTRRTRTHYSSIVIRHEIRKKENDTSDFLLRFAFDKLQLVLDKVRRRRRKKNENDESFDFNWFGLVWIETCGRIFRVQKTELRSVNCVCSFGSRHSARIIEKYEMRIRERWWATKTRKEKKRNEKKEALNDGKKILDDCYAMNNCM